MWPTPSRPCGFERFLAFLPLQACWSCFWTLGKVMFFVSRVASHGSNRVLVGVLGLIMKFAVDATKDDVLWITRCFATVHPELCKLVSMYVWRQKMCGESPEGLTKLVLKVSATVDPRKSEKARNDRKFAFVGIYNRPSPGRHRIIFGSRNFSCINKTWFSNPSRHVGKEGRMENVAGKGSGKRKGQKLGNGKGKGQEKGTWKGKRKRKRKEKDPGGKNEVGKDGR